MLAHLAAPYRIADTVSCPASSPVSPPVGSNRMSHGSISPHLASYVNWPIIDRAASLWPPGGVVASHVRSHAELRRRIASHARTSRRRNGTRVTPPYEIVAGQRCSAG